MGMVRDDEAAAERQRRYQTRVAELAAAARARGQQPRARIKPRRQDEAPNSKATANVTDPDSRFLHTRKGSVQGYNAAAGGRPDPGRRRDPRPPRDAAGRLGSWSIANLTSIPDAPELLVWPSKTGRTGKPRKDGKPSASRSHGLRAAMFAKLASEQGKACYTLRKQTVEPVFGQLKEHQGARRFTRRGLGACEAAWKLL
jgi:hypothetical protein